MSEALNLWTHPKFGFQTSNFFEPAFPSTSINSTTTFTRPFTLLVLRVNGAKVSDILQPQAPLEKTDVSAPIGLLVEALKASQVLVSSQLKSVFVFHSGQLEVFHPQQGEQAGRDGHRGEVPDTQGGRDA